MSKPWPERRQDSLYMSGALRWVWLPTEETLQLLNVDGVHG
jgi:hypothetical protein